MRRIWPLFVAGFAAICAAQAAEPEQQLQLTVYRSNLALVQDVRRLTVPSGRTKLEFKDVSAGIRPETVTLSGQGLSVVEQNFDYDLLTPAKMMEKAVGKQIKILRTLPGSGKEVPETATVLSVNDGVVLKIGDHIEVLRDDGIPTRVIFNSIPENLRASPTLSVTVDSGSSGPRDTTLSYLTTGLSWEADYVALFNESRGSLRLQGWVTLKNQSGSSFKDAKTQLVAGDINIVSGEEDWWQRQQSSRNSNLTAGRGPSPDEAIADYLLYKLPERVTIAQNQTKQVSFIELNNVKASKAYEYRPGSFDSDDNPEHVSVVVKFTNDKQALPAGIARVYMHDQSGDSKFIGENYLDNSPAGSDVGINIGDAFDVTVKPTIVTSEKLGRSRRRYAMSYLFRNAQPKDISVDVRQSGLWRDGKVEIESQPSTRTDAHTLSWKVPVPANGQSTLTFTVDTGG